MAKSQLSLHYLVHNGIKCTAENTINKELKLSYEIDARFLYCAETGNLLEPAHEWKKVKNASINSLLTALAVIIIIWLGATAATIYFDPPISKTYSSSQEG